MKRFLLFAFFIGVCQCEISDIYEKCAKKENIPFEECIKQSLQSTEALNDEEIEPFQRKVNTKETKIFGIRKMVYPNKWPLQDASFDKEKLPQKIIEGFSNAGKILLTRRFLGSVPKAIEAELAMIMQYSSQLQNEQSYSTIQIVQDLRQFLRTMDPNQQLISLGEKQFLLRGIEQGIQLNKQLIDNDRQYMYDEDEENYDLSEPLQDSTWKDKMIDLAKKYGPKLAEQAIEILFKKKEGRSGKSLDLKTLDDRMATFIHNSENNHYRSSKKIVDFMKILREYLKTAAAKGKTVSEKDLKSLVSEANDEKPAPRRWNESFRSNSLSDDSLRSVNRRAMNDDYE